MYLCASSTLTREGGYSTRTIRELGARLGNMVNVSELLINIVRINKPKMLIGLNQKVCDWLFL